jgi:5-methylcytosine-specific restriction endonuclease McrA
MPIRAPRICGLCGGVHADGERCPKTVERDRERKARFDDKRPCARARGYTRTWEAERRAFLKLNPTCCRCGEPASVVDHIKPHKGDDRLFWDRTNWQPLCRHCHNSAKQAQEKRK